ncbi:MAG: hypothetical protein DRI57_31800 [Deltaproteobacteria bacterium]|nr:MAG: hypothetical protein DRI57_31800 [Deltaproteobacteria bacterium]
MGDKIMNIIIDPDSKKWLVSFLGANVKFDEPMSRHTSLRVGGPADVYVTPETREDLFRIIRGCRERDLRYAIIGGGTNLLVKDNGIRGIAILLKKCFNQIAQTGTRGDDVIVTAMAGSGLARVCRFANEHGLEGMEFALGIPGTVGGAIMMNAGTAYGSMKNVLDSVNILLPTGQTWKIEKQYLKFDYRKLDIAQGCRYIAGDGQPVILDGQFCLHPSDPAKLKREAEKILQTRKSSQPTDAPSAGCFFKNPEMSAISDQWSVTLENGQRITRETGVSAGRLIDLAGLRGKRIGGAEVSAKHANFIINRDNASAADILSLAELIRETVLKMFNINLETEVKIIGE